MEITAKTIIADVLKACPSSVEVFDKFNMGCMSCMGVANESIEKGSRMHGLDPDEVVAELVKFVAGCKS
ncbi:MAG TPA: disulfide oxidoreductase [Deferribacteraceae bacterium]|nr:disulfide oxidoreductase [Deferribacteraceae bacterium]